MKSGRSRPRNGCDSAIAATTCGLMQQLVSYQERPRLTFWEGIWSSLMQQPIYVVNLSRNKEPVHHQNTEPQDQKMKDWMVVEHQEGVI